MVKRNRGRGRLKVSADGRGVVGHAGLVCCNARPLSLCGQPVLGCRVAEDESEQLGLLL